MTDKKVSELSIDISLVVTQSILRFDAITSDFLFAAYLVESGSIPALSHLRLMAKIYHYTSQVAQALAFKLAQA
jgi:hypothetical protein